MSEILDADNHDQQCTFLPHQHHHHHHHSVDTFPIKMPDSIDIEDIKQLQKSIQDKLKPRKPTPAQKLRSTWASKSTKSQLSATRRYGNWQPPAPVSPPRTPESQKDADIWSLLSDGDRPAPTAASQAPSTPRTDKEAQIDEDIHWADPQSAAAGAADRIQRRDWQGELTSETDRRIAEVTPKKKIPPPPRQAINFATSSLALVGKEAGLIGMSGMVGPSQWDGAGAARPLSRPTEYQSTFTGAVSKHNPLRGLFDDPHAKAREKAALEQGLAFAAGEDDPYMGAGNAAGYGVGHEAALSKRSGLSYGVKLATAKVRGMKVHMFQDDSDDSEDSDPDERATTKLRDHFIQTGEGLVAYQPPGVAKARRQARARAAEKLPGMDEHGASVMSVTVPALSAAAREQAGVASANADRLIRAALAKTPLAGDPRRGMFKASEKITKLAGNRTRRAKLDQEAARLGFAPSKTAPADGQAITGRRRKQRAAPVAAGVTPQYTLGGASGLGAGLGRVKSTGKFSDTTLNDGSIFTGGAMAAMLADLESGRSVRALRAELEDARRSMESSANMLQLRKQDWFSALDAQVAQYQEQDLTSSKHIFRSAQ